MTLLLLVKQPDITSHVCILTTAYLFSMVLKTDEVQYHVRFDEFILLWPQGAIKEHLSIYYVSDTILKISDISSHFILTIIQ